MSNRRQKSEALSQIELAQTASKTKTGSIMLSRLKFFSDHYDVMRQQLQQGN